MGCEYYAIWKGLALFASLGFVFAACLLWHVWGEGYEAGKDRAIRDGMGVDSKTFAGTLANVMEVQADGGDSPADYTAWALREAQKMHRKSGGYYQSAAQEVDR